MATANGGTAARLVTVRASPWTRVFSMCLIDWANDFLFATDGTTNASMLLSPLQATNAQLMTTTAAENEDDIVTSHWLLLPAFSVAGVSVGLVVVDEMGDAPRLMRYCRDDDTGTTLCIGDLGDGNMEVEHVVYNSNFESVRTYCHFAPALRSHLRARKAAVTVDENVVRAALTVYIVLNESRASCSTCGSLPTGVRCGCRFAFRRARHPLDFPHVAQNTVPLLGDFRGRGRNVAFERGIIATSRPVVTELRTRAGGPAGTTEKLRFWAARHCLGQGKPNPLMLEMPPVGIEEAEKLADSFLQIEPDDVKVEPEKSPPDKTTPEIVAKDENVESLRRCVSSMTMVPTHEVNHVTTTPMAQRTPHLLPATRQVSGQIQVVPSITLSDEASTPSSGPSLGPMGMGTAVLPSLPVVVAPAVYTASGVAPRKRAWTAIAPSAVPPAAGEQYSSAERRKILKREAAARSNAKRREVVALQRQLGKAKTLMDKLRAREKELRRENERLREQTSSVGLRTG